MGTDCKTTWLDSGLQTPGSTLLYKVKIIQYIHQGLANNIRSKDESVWKIICCSYQADGKGFVSDSLCVCDNNTRQYGFYRKRKLSPFILQEVVSHWVGHNMLRGSLIGHLGRQSQSQVILTFADTCETPCLLVFYPLLYIVRFYHSKQLVE